MKHDKFNDTIKKIKIYFSRLPDNQGESGLAFIMS